MLLDANLARCEGRQPVTRLTERERFLRAEVVALSLQAVWASTRPARDRTVRCSLHWRRRGDPRLHPAIPGSAAQAELGLITSAHSRGGAPKGERSQMTAPAPAYRGVGTGGAPFGAPPPFLEAHDLGPKTGPHFSGLCAKGGTMNASLAFEANFLAA